MAQKEDPRESEYFDPFKDTGETYTDPVWYTIHLKNPEPEEPAPKKEPAPKREAVIEPGLLSLLWYFVVSPDRLPWFVRGILLGLWMAYYLY